MMLHNTFDGNACSTFSMSRCSNDKSEITCALTTETEYSKIVFAIRSKTDVGQSMHNTYSVQCAAVRTHLLLMIEPPQKCRLNRCNETWYGASVMSISVPPTMRPSSRGNGNSGSSFAVESKFYYICKTDKTADLIQSNLIWDAVDLAPLQSIGAEEFVPSLNQFNRTSKSKEQNKCQNTIAMSGTTQSIWQMKLDWLL